MDIDEYFEKSSNFLLLQEEAEQSQTMPSLLSEEEVDDQQFPKYFSLMVWQKFPSRILIKTFQTFKIITRTSNLTFETCESDIEILDKSHVKSTKVQLKAKNAISVHCNYYY